MPKVSVVIPSYNHARFLRQRIRSVLEQTYTDLEVLLLDDASRDDSLEVLRRYRHEPRVRLLLANETNSGSPFKQWNKGVRLAEGEYVWIAESDDDADPRLLESLVRVLDENPSVGLAYCQSSGVDGSGRVLSDREPWMDLSPRWARDFVASGVEECRTQLASMNTIPNASAVLFRRSVYEAAGYAPEHMRLCGDWMMWVRMLLISDVGFVARPLNRFRTHDTSVRAATMRLGRYQEEAYQVLQLIQERAAPPADSLGQARQTLAGGWAEALLSSAAAWRSVPRVYRWAKRSDPGVELRLGKNLLFLLLQGARRGA